MPRVKPKLATVMYAVMVNNEMYPGSLSLNRWGAESYLEDARRAAVEGAAVRVVKLTITEPDEEDT